MSDCIAINGKIRSVPLNILSSVYSYLNAISNQSPVAQFCIKSSKVIVLI